MSKYYCNACLSPKTCFHECDNNGVAPVNCLYDKIHEPDWRVIKKTPNSDREKFKQLMTDIFGKSPLIDLLANICIPENPIINEEKDREAREAMAKMHIKPKSPWPRPKEQELMTLSEALKKRNKTDSLLAERSGFYMRSALSADYIESPDFNFHSVRTNWQIIPVEPKETFNDKFKKSIEACEGCKAEDRGWGQNPCAVCVVNPGIEDRFRAVEKPEPKVLNDKEIVFKDWWIEQGYSNPQLYANVSYEHAKEIFEGCEKSKIFKPLKAE